MGRIAYAWLVGALCLACGGPQLYLAEGGEASSLDPGDMDRASWHEDDGEDMDNLDDAENAENGGRAVESTIFIPLPDVQIYTLEYPGMFAGQLAWFADDPASGRIRRAFYLVPVRDAPQGRSKHAGAVGAVGELLKTCGQGCRRGLMRDVDAAWAASLEQWGGSGPEAPARALADAGARPGALTGAAAWR